MAASVVSMSVGVAASVVSMSVGVAASVVSMSVGVAASVVPMSVGVAASVVPMSVRMAALVISEEPVVHVAICEVAFCGNLAAACRQVMHAVVKNPKLLQRMKE